MEQGRWQWWIGIPALALALHLAVEVTWTVVSGYSAAPVSDYWWTINDFRLGRDANPVAWAWGRVQEHRHFLPRLLMWADWRFWEGTGAPLVWLGLALQALQSYFVLKLWPNEEDPGLRWIPVAAALACAFYPSQHENLTRPYQICFFVTMSAAALAALLMVRGRPGWAFVSALAGGLSMSSGLLIGPVITVGAWLLGMERRVWLRMGAGWAVFAGLYLYGFREGGQPLPGLDTGRLKDYAVFFVNLFALPWQGFPAWWAAKAAQLALLGCGVVSLLVFVKRDWRKPEWIGCLLMIWFIGAACAMTAYGRLGSGITPRYFTPTLLFWPYAVALGFRLLGGRTPLRLAWALAVTVLLVGVWRTREVPTQGLKADLDARRTATAALMAGVNDQVAMFPLGAYGFLATDNMEYIEGMRKAYRAGWKTMQIPVKVGGPAVPLTVNKVSASFRPGYRIEDPRCNAPDPGPMPQMVTGLDGTWAGNFVLGADGRCSVFLPARYANQEVLVRRGPALWERLKLPDDPNRLPLVGAERGAWEPIWLPGQPLEGVGLAVEKGSEAAVLRPQRGYSHVRVRTPRPIAEYRSIVVKLKSDIEDFAGLIGRRPEGDFGWIPSAGEWLYMKIHVRRLAGDGLRHQDLRVAVAAIYGRREELGGIWGSMEGAPESDLGVQFYRERGRDQE
jgi:hypothetical protein